LTGDPVEEVKVAKEVLKALEIRQFGVRFISCPTCGRTQINMIELARQVEARLTGITTPITVAVMGCAVNGPGEAREADVGVAGGKGEGLIFKKGEIIKKVPEDAILEALLEEVDKFLAEGAN
jgi:(E)-4-hydroxy-3-methylbut-2-enyl-diphosphate synthase